MISNPFRQRIERGEITDLEELRAWYRAEAKRLHPDLQGVLAPGIDFDRLKKHYHEALKILVDRQDKAEGARPEPKLDAEAAPLLLGSFLEEFRNLVARGFPVNVQAAAKNWAYAASIRRVAAFLAQRFDNQEFFVKANAETRALKRTDPTIHWYVLQIYWNIGDFNVTGFDYYRRIYVRHLEFIRQPLVEGGYLVLLSLLEFLVGGEKIRRAESTQASSKSPRPGT